MKKLSIVLVMLISLTVSSQNNLIFQYQKDVMTDKEYVFINKGLLCSNDGKIGFIITPSFSLKDSLIVYNGITVKSAGIGACVESCTIIILFDNGEKLTLNQWNKFNCEGNSYYDFRKDEIKNLNHKIKSIRFTNGRTYDSFTYDCKINESEYFTEIVKLLVSQKKEIIKN